MIRKESEERLTNLLKTYHIWWRKLVDVVICPKCGQFIYKKERQVDYLAIIGNQPALIECKQAETSFQFANPDIGIRPIQRQIMTDWEERGVHSWIFLLMGNGSFPNDKQAWLFPWTEWRQFIEPYLVEKQLKSLPWKSNLRKSSVILNAATLLLPYHIPYRRGKGLYMPEDHWFALQYTDLFKLTPMPYWSMDFAEVTHGVVTDPLED
jgi:hypothetical protein